MTTSPAFLAAVEDLFRRLGLGRPRTDATGIVRLRIEAHGINLSDDGRGACVIEGPIGPLPSDGPARGRAVRDVLKGSPGFLLANEACVFLRRQQPSGETLVVKTLHPLAQNAPERLVRRIEDVLALVEFHTAALSGAGAGRSVSRIERDTQDAENAVIFRL